jgi:hypothetical protein
MSMNPMDGVWVASFSDKAERFNGTHIIFLDEVSLIVDLFNDSNSSWCHIKTLYLILLADSPDNSSIWGDWLSFEKD